jgi:hypothetical protein
MLFEKIELEPSEIVLKVVRKHWFIIGAELLATISLVFLPVLVLFSSFYFPDTSEITQLLIDYEKIFILIIIFWTLMVSLSAFMIWTNYYLDLWIITDRRIITVDQVQFFHRKVSSFRLERLQDIKVTIKGIIPTFLNFGTLKAQTASAAESNFISTGLPDPRELQSTIQKAMDERLQTLRDTHSE